MATKTSSKTATRKPAASAAGRKTTAAQKPADVEAKAKVPQKGPVAPAEPTTSAKQLKSQPEKADVSGHATPHPTRERHIVWGVFDFELLPQPAAGPAG